MEISSWAVERMTRREAAEYLGLSPATLEVWASTGRYSLPFVKVGRRAFYRRSDLDEWIRSRTVQFAG
jgi:excisionase family DNA binding protein